MNGPKHTHDSPNLHLVEDELRTGLENSRQLLRQSRILIELSEADAANAGDDFSVTD